MRLIERISTISAQVGVVGLGYVGLTEAVALARAGFRVTGFDVDQGRVGAVQSHRSYVIDVPDEELALAVQSWNLKATADFGALRTMDVILICVPTPLSKTRTPDISYILAAADAIQAHLRPGQLIVLESTTYPGTTTEVLLPAFERTGLRVGEDFHLCFSPERINPGDKEHPVSTIPRIIGGVTPECAAVASGLFARIASEVVTVSSPAAAEMVKLLENTFRAVNIGLVNEIALMCRALRVDVWEIIDAAATKPFGFMPFYPGPGLGGHCIPIDPLYLSWKARINGFEPRFIDLAHQVNSAMPRFVVSLLIEALNDRGRTVNGARILVLGVSYKRDVNDARESPALEIIHELRRRGATVLYHDPHVATVRVDDRTLTSVPLETSLMEDVDCVLILTDHTAVDYKRVVEAAPLVVDTRNATAALVDRLDKVVRL
ncbi:MAG TPA: nucleotide sugar dehydrogenase [Candidatus Binatia bacterium]|nr:nucleotide sugar dehydrogenase [Candidatus Binatia bacterium]